MDPRVVCHVQVQVQKTGEGHQLFNFLSFVYIYILLGVLFRSVHTDLKALESIA
jgi:hypothetical protein